MGPASTLLVAALACMPLGWAQEAETKAAPKDTLVVEVKPDRIILMDITKAGRRLVAVGERGFALVSDDAGNRWQAIKTPVSRTLTSVAFKDDKLGIAVGHGASMVRTEDGGNTWTQIDLPDAGIDSLLGVTHVEGDHFIAYGAFALYLDSADGGRSWQRRPILEEDFDRHISQVLPLGSALLLVAESGTLARSDDGGVTWTRLASPYEGSYFGAVAGADGAVLAFGMRGNIFRSTDLGATWQKIELGTTTSLMSGERLSDGRILLLGNSGLLALSKDNGQTMELHWTPTGSGLTAVVETPEGLVTTGERGIAKLDPAWLVGK
jgi:photosystem II stability/assembly factor-like uncharacterized protein